MGRRVRATHMPTRRRRLYREYRERQQIRDDINEVFAEMTNYDRLILQPRLKREQR